MVKLVGFLFLNKNKKEASAKLAKSLPVCLEQPVETEQCAVQHRLSTDTHTAHISPAAVCLPVCLSVCLSKRQPLNTEREK